MEQTRVRNMVLIGFGVVLMFALRWLNQHWFVGHQVQEKGFSYEMPRLQHERSRFDLSDRDIDDQVLENIEKKAEQKKAAEVAKKAVAPVAKKATAATSSTAAPKKPSVSLQLVDTSRELHMDATTEMASRSETGNLSRSSSAPVAAATTATATTSNASTNTVQSSGLSAAEWKTLLQNSPSATTISQFVSAHASKQISDSDFYAITFALLQSSNSQQQTTAASILKQDTSANSFTYMAKEYQVIASSLRASLWTVMLTYAQATKLPLLQTSLQSGNTAAINLGLQVLTVAVTNAQSQISAGTATSSSALVTALKAMESTLTKVQQTDTADASTAATLLSEIQSL